MAAAWVLVASSWCTAQEASIWAPQQFTSQNGLPQNSVNDLLLDGQGYLWITTEGGLIRYDGHRFQEVELPVLGVPQEDRLRDMLPLLDGTIIVRNAGGDRFILRETKVLEVERRKGDFLARPMVNGGLPAAGLYDVLMAEQHRLWGRNLGSQERIWSLPLDAHRWITAGPAGLTVGVDSLVGRRVTYRKILAAHFMLQGVLYGMDTGQGLVRIDTLTGATTPVMVEGVPVELVRTAMSQTASWQDLEKDHAVVPYGNGVLLLRPGSAPGSVRGETLPVELPTGCVVTCLVWSERHHVLFVGTDTKGLFIYRQRTLYSRTCGPVREGANRAYYALHVLGTDSVLAFNGAYRTLFTPYGCINLWEGDDHRPFNYQFVLPTDKDRVILARQNMLVEVDLRTGTENVLMEKVPGDLVASALQRGDSLWLGNAQGIGVLHQGRYRQIAPATNGGCFRWWDGRLWAATCQGVQRISSDGAVDKLGGIPRVCVRSMEAVEDLRFIGTYGEGAWVMVNGLLLQLPMDKQGFLTHVHTFVPDRQGRLWMSTNRGIFSVKLQDLRAWIADHTRHLYYAYYGQDDGLLNPELNGGCDPAYAILKDGSIVFPSLEGLVQFNPALMPDPVPQGRVMITAVELDGAEQSAAAGLKFPPDHGELRVRLSLPYWGSPVNLQLEYMLEGVDQAWRSLDFNERDIRFTRLAPGLYELLVRKLGAPDDEEPVRLRFEVLTPFYKQRWFLLCMGLLAGLLFFLVLRIRDNRLRRRNEELELAVKERTHEIEMANARLQRSMEVKERLVSIISHDIVTPLRFIAGVARDMVRPGTERAVQQAELRDIAVSSDKLYANARNMLSWIKHQEGRIELRPRHIALNPLVEEALDVVRELATGQGDVLINDVALDDVLRTDKDVLLIILQNIIANAVNYTRGGEVRVQGVQEGDHYVIRVSDTGPGITPKALAHVRDILSGERGRRGTGHGDPEMQGLGYVIIGELSAMLGGGVEVAPGKERGTVVILHLPLRWDRTVDED